MRNSRSDAFAWLRPPRFALPACGITSDLAAVFGSLVEWLVVSSRELGERETGMAGFIIMGGNLPCPLSCPDGAACIIWNHPNLTYHYIERLLPCKNKLPK